MHNAAYAAMHLDWRYRARQVPAPELESTLAALRAEEALGANLTIPHKQAVIPMLAHITSRAAQIGAVNTIRLHPEGWHGDNTDGPGWLDSWDEEVGQEMAGRPALVIGAGGAARSILWALHERKASKITVLNRNPERARSLHHTIAPLADFAEHLEAGAIVVQTTSVGMWPDVEASPVEWPAEIPPGVVACDLVYNPRPTLFLQQAAQRGAATLDGLGMLVHQAARAIRWWSGREDIPTTFMRTAIE